WIEPVMGEDGFAEWALHGAYSEFAALIQSRDETRPHGTERAIAIHECDGAAIVERRHGGIVSVRIAFPSDNLAHHGPARRARVTLPFSPDPQRSQCA